MDFRLAVVLEGNGRVSQTAVLAEEAGARAAGHRLLHILEPEIAVFAARVQEILERDLRIPAESNAYSGRSRSPIPGEAEHPDRARRTPRSVATLGRSTSLASFRSSSLSASTRP